MEMLGIMHKADPYGHLLVNGKVPTEAQVAALARAPADQVRSLLHELEEAGVFSRTRKGVIYSRRLTRDEQHRKDGETAQKLNGNVPGSRRWQAAEKQAQKTPPPEVVNRVVDQPPPHPEARSQRLEEKKVSPVGETKEKRATRLPADFEMPDEWLQAGVLARERHRLPALDYRLECERFCSYWWSRAGAQARKVDWMKTWTNWCLNAKGELNGSRRQSAVNNLWEGAARAVASFETRERTDCSAADPFLDS